MHKFAPAAPLVLAALALAAPRPASADIGKVLARDGDSAPQSDLPLTDFGVPTVNDEGAVAVTGTFEDPSVAVQGSNVGLYVYAESGDAVDSWQVIRRGDLLPGSIAMDAPVEVTGFEDHRLGDDRSVTFRGSSGAVTLGGVYFWDRGSDGGAPTKVVFTTDQVPDAPDADTRWGQIGTTRHGDGAIVWLTELTGPGGGFNKAVVRYRASDAAPAIVARVSDPAPPGISSDAVLGDIGSIAGNAAGSFAYTAEIFIPSLPTEDVRALVIDGQIAHDTRDTAPGFSAAFVDFEFPEMNDAGDVLFIGRVDTFRVLFVRSDGESTALTGEGSPAIVSGGASIATGAITRDRALLSGSGDVALLATVEGPNVDASNDEILYFYPFADRTNVQIIARKGDPAPDMPEGVVFSGLGAPTQPMAMNPNGNVLFPAQLSGPGISQAANDSLWLYNAATGEVTKVIQDGDVVMADGVEHTVAEFRVQLGSGGEDGERVGYSSTGWVGLWTRLAPVSGGPVQTFISVVNVDDPSLNEPGGGGGGESAGGMDGGSDDGGGGGCSVVPMRPWGSAWGAIGLVVLATRRRRSHGV